MTMPKPSVIKDDTPFYFRFFKVNLLLTKFYSVIVFCSLFKLYSHVYKFNYCHSVDKISITIR